MKLLQMKHSYTQSHNAFFEYDFNESSKCIESELHSFDSVLVRHFIDFVLTEYGIDVAAELVEGVVRQSNWSVIVGVGVIVFLVQIGAVGQKINRRICHLQIAQNFGLR